MSAELGNPINPRPAKSGSPEWRKRYAEDLRASRKPGMFMCYMCVKVRPLEERSTGYRSGPHSGLCTHCSSDISYYGCE